MGRYGTPAMVTIRVPSGVVRSKSTFLSASTTYQSMLCATRWQSAVMTADCHLVAHNMDWYVVDADKNVLFDLTTPDGTRIVTIAGVPYLPILGMNSVSYTHLRAHET